MPTFYYATSAPDAFIGLQIASEVRLMKSVVVFGLTSCLIAVSAVANGTGSQKANPAAASKDVVQPGCTVSIPIYNPRCSSWVPVSQRYRAVPVEGAEAARKAYEECR